MNGVSEKRLKESKESGDKTEFKLERSIVHENISYGNTDYAVKKASPDDDKNKRIDLFAWIKKVKYSFDAKAPKKINSFDPEPSKTHTWIELNNTKGNIGWLYGKATHIAFEHEGWFLLVNRKKLVNLIEENVDMTAEPKIKKRGVAMEIKDYEKIQREGQEDIMVLVPYKVLEEIMDYRLFIYE